MRIVIAAHMHVAAFQASGNQFFNFSRCHKQSLEDYRGI
jgi:hypothetical protein